MVCALYDLPEDEGEEEGAHLPEKVHGACHRTGIIAAKIGACDNYYRSSDLKPILLRGLVSSFFSSSSSRHLKTTSMFLL